MNINLKKKKILIVLNNHYGDGEQKTGHGWVVTDLGKSLTNIEIHDRTDLKLRDINDCCISLSTTGHLQIYNKDDKDKAHRYLITDAGRQAVIDDFYGGLIRDKRFGRVKDSMLVLIALLSFLATLYINMERKKSDVAMKMRIELLEQKLKQVDSKK
jgi:hypothetical protein